MQIKKIKRKTSGRINEKSTGELQEAVSYQWKKQWNNNQNH